jgi:hypothetical protein
MKTEPWSAGLATVLVAAAVPVLGACDQDYTYPMADALGDVLPDAYYPGPDVTYDPGSDPGYDAGHDPAADAGSDPVIDPVEEGGEGPCIYPEGPHMFRSIGNIVPPMAWPSAIPGSTETSIAADLEDYFCDPEVNSVFIMVTHTS